MKQFILMGTALLFLGGALNADLAIYPENVRNPRIPMIPPAANGAKGKALPFDSLCFEYPVVSPMNQESTGSAIFQIRENRRRESKTFFSLTGKNGEAFSFFSEPAFAGRKLYLQYNAPKRNSVKSAPLPPLPPGVWKSVRLEWGKGKAVVVLDGKQTEIALPETFKPERMKLYTSGIDELILENPAGTVKVDWEKDYRAEVTLRRHSNQHFVRLFGFDSYVISDRPGNRDYPMIGLYNSGRDKVETRVEFSLKNEIGGKKWKWSQDLSADGGSSSLVPVRFPEKLASDVYHLTMKVQGHAGEDRHFLYTPRRNEGKGDEKFGLHDVNGADFGFWPDALPIDISHKYLRWGYVQGPAWVKDRGNGTVFGLDASVPPEEWYWNPNLEWEMLSGHKMFVCIQCNPLTDWMRAKGDSRLTKHSWGFSGGMPKLDLAAKFVRAAALRYRGKVRLWEIENEPNAGNTWYSSRPADYVQLSRMVRSELKKADPENVVFGISGTSDFENWVPKVFAAGGSDGMDGVSWHTYANPDPDEALLSKLRITKSAARGKTRYFNSETGHMCVLREKVDEMLPKEYVEKQVAERALGFVSRTAWPGRVYDERSAGTGMIRNAVLNFREGAEAFVFFGWSPLWPSEKQNWKVSGTDFSVISITPEGVRTPSQYTLALAVLSTQLESALLHGIQQVELLTMRGAVFPKRNGGKVAVVWPLLPMPFHLAESNQATLEIVDQTGHVTWSRSSVRNENGKYVHKLVLNEEPVYLHVGKNGSIAFPPPPVEKILSGPGANGMHRVSLTLQNPSEQSAVYTISGEKGFRPETVTLEIPAKGRSNAEFLVPSRPGKENFTVNFQIRSRSVSYVFPVSLKERPRMEVERLPDNLSAEWDQFRSLKGLPLDRAEQVVIGAPPKLVSLQDPMFWGGPAELSGEVRVGYNGKGIFIAVKVCDAVAKPDPDFPGVQGSVLELFFDFRKADAGFGRPLYGKQVFQFLIQPGIKPIVWSPQIPKGKMASTGIVCSSTPLGKEYSTVLFLPWKFTGLTPVPGTAFGFDLGIDAPWPDKAKRKSQIMLFGTAENSRNASAFGIAVIK